MPRSRNKRSILFQNVVQNMHHRIRLRNIGDGMTRQDSLHRLAKDFPLLRPPEIVDHQEPATLEVFPQPRSLDVTQSPPSCLRRIDPGIVKNSIVCERHMAWITSVNSG